MSSWPKTRMRESSATRGNWSLAAMMEAASRVPTCSGARYLIAGLAREARQFKWAAAAKAFLRLAASLAISAFEMRAEGWDS